MGNDFRHGLLGAALVATPLYVLVAGVSLVGGTLLWASSNHGLTLFNGMNSVFDLVVLYAIPILLFAVIMIVTITLQIPAQIVFKVAADVVRYIGLEPYRQEIHNRLRTALSTIPKLPESHLVILAHSLGSVIAVDHLVTELAADRDPARLTLVTMGSPLRRLFWRFFPEIYPSVESLSTYLHQRFAPFHWINLHRPLDYVGGSLNSRWVQEVLIRTATRTHTNYWREQKLGDALDGAFCEVSANSFQWDGGAQHTSAPSVWPSNLITASSASAFTFMWQRRDILLRGLSKLAFPCVFLWGLLCLFQIVHPSRPGSDLSMYWARLLCVCWVLVMMYCAPRPFVRAWLAALLGAADNIESPSRTEVRRDRPKRLAITRGQITICVVILAAIVIGRILFLAYNRGIWATVGNDVHSLQVESMAFSADGDLLVASTGSEVGIKRATTGREFSWGKNFGQAGLSIYRLSPDGKFALVSENGAFYLYRLQGNQLIRDSASALAVGPVFNAAVGADGAYVAIVNSTGTQVVLSIIKISTHASSSPILLPSHSVDPTAQLSFSSDNSCITVPLADSVLEVEGLDAEQPRLSPIPLSDPYVTAVAPSQGCAFVAVAHSHSVEVWEKRDKNTRVVARQPLGSAVGNPERVLALVFSPNNLLAAASDLGFVRVWDWHRYRYFVKPEFVELSGWGTASR